MILVSPAPPTPTPHTHTHTHTHTYTHTHTRDPHAASPRRFGRKNAIVLFAVFRVAGAVLQVAAPSYAVLAVARFLVGVGVMGTYISGYVLSEALWWTGSGWARRSPAGPAGPAGGVSSVSSGWGQNGWPKGLHEGGSRGWGRADPGSGWAGSRPIHVGLGQRVSSFVAPGSGQGAGAFSRSRVGALGISISGGSGRHWVIMGPRCACVRVCLISGCVCVCGFPCLPPTHTQVDIVHPRHHTRTPQSHTRTFHSHAVSHRQGTNLCAWACVRVYACPHASLPPTQTWRSCTRGTASGSPW